MSSGRRYDYSSGHYLVICGTFKGIIGVVVYSKLCQRRDGVDKRIEVSQEHEFPTSFERSSNKSTEDDAILKVTEDSFCHCCFIFDIIISDNDRTSIKSPLGKSAEVIKIKT